MFSTFKDQQKLVAATYRKVLGNCIDKAVYIPCVLTSKNLRVVCFAMLISATFEETFLDMYSSFKLNSRKAVSCKQISSNVKIKLELI